VESKANFIKLDFGNLLGKTSPGQKDKKVLWNNLRKSSMFLELSVKEWHCIPTWLKTLGIDSQ
jgi:hypothetical protein